MFHPYFSFRGRQRRMSYLVHMGWLTIALIIGTIWAEHKFQEAPLFIAVVLGLLAIHQINAVGLTVQRLHDMGHSGWFCLGLWFPGLVFLYKNPNIIMELHKWTFTPDNIDWGLLICTMIFVLGLLFSPGFEGENKYEDDYVD